MLCDALKDVRAFFAKNGGDWPVVSDTDGRIATDWGVTGVPETYLVDAKGQAVPRHVMHHLKELVDKRIDELEA